MATLVHITDTNPGSRMRGHTVELLNLFDSLPEGGDTGLLCTKSEAACIMRHRRANAATTSAADGLLVRRVKTRAIRSRAPKA
jgi:hypothetical protein